MKVVIASTNPAKIEAVKIAFEDIYRNIKFEFISFNAKSSVSRQPIGQETLKGATNRANDAYCKIPNANFWVGIEGGIEKNGNEYEVFAWIVVKTKDRISRGKTGTFVLPAKVGNLIDQGMELGEADDIVFGLKDSKKSIGAVGILTHGKITRALYYTEAVKLALIPFINKEYYE